MGNISKIDPFGFLNLSREKRFIQGINDYNNSHFDAVAKRPYQKMSRRGQANNTREWWLAYIMESFVDDEGADARQIKNMYTIEFDKTWLVRFKLVQNPEELTKQPRTIQRAKYENSPKQLELAILDDIPEEEPKNTPLSTLYHIEARYMKDKNLVTSLYFTDCNESQIFAQQPLNMSTTIIVQPLQELDVPRPIVKLKANVKKRDE